MTDDTNNLEAHFDQLTAEDRDRLETRLQQHRDRLEAEGYELSIAEGEGGFFAGVLVIDDKHGRFGFLEADGTVNWLGGDVGGIGALGSAIVQNPGDELQRSADGLEHLDVE